MQHRFHLRIYATLAIVAAEGGLQRIVRAAGQQAVEIERPPGFRPGARQSLAAERLYAHHRANHVAVDVKVSDVRRPGDLGNGFVDAGMHTERQAVARGIDLADQIVQLAAGVAHHV